MGTNKETIYRDPKTGIVIDVSRDGRLTDFAKKLITDYYLKDGESIQEGFARASFAWSSDNDHAQRLYDAVSKGWFMFASPVLSNAPSAIDVQARIFDKAKALPISCFTGETLISTDKGYVKIEELNLGDKVLSDDGSYNEVINKWSSESEDMYEIEIDGETIEVTGNHLFLTKDHGWVRVDELNSDIHELVKLHD